MYRALERTLPRLNSNNGNNVSLHRSVCTVWNVLLTQFCTVLSKKNVVCYLKVLSEVVRGIWTRLITFSAHRKCRPCTYLGTEYRFQRPCSFVCSTGPLDQAARISRSQLKITAAPLLGRRNGTRVHCYCLGCETW